MEKLKSKIKIITNIKKNTVVSYILQHIEQPQIIIKTINNGIDHFRSGNGYSEESMSIMKL